jgi:predicted nucleic acid-binding protein
LDRARIVTLGIPERPGWCDAAAFPAVESALESANLAEAMMAGNEFVVSTEIVMRLIAGSNCSASDCEFVALAEKQNLPLVTVDRGVLRAFPKIAISLDRFAQR